MRFRGVFEIGSFYNGANGTRRLTKPAKNALGQIDVISRSSTRTIRSLLRFDGNRSCWTRQLAQSTRDASFLSRWISTQSVFTSISRRYWSFLKRIHNGHFRLEDSQRSLQQRGEYIVHHVMFALSRHSVHHSLFINMRILLCFEWILPHPLLIRHEHRIRRLHKGTALGFCRGELQHFGVWHIVILQRRILRVAVLRDHLVWIGKRLQLLLQ
mmetsp:Transcript_24357/g.38574  ORF Transcript_24357/g.38574 Transcript_24357/m.38574 type:complete len:213 (-) Transcript_24357:443-1081(-)